MNVKSNSKADVKNGGEIIDHVVMCWLPFDLNSSA